MWQSLYISREVIGVSDLDEVTAVSTFARVQQLLDKAIADWTTQHGRAPILAKHNGPFGWSTRDQLVSSKAFGLPLLSQKIIDAKDGDNANLVIALRTGIPGFPRMPNRGPYMIDAEIEEIVDWINAGALP
ncbi:hypothetical protein ACVDG8_014605 [Mesorhizobium sp. ORM8.1]